MQIVLGALQDAFLRKSAKMELMSLILPWEIYYRNTFHDSACGCAKNLKGVKKGKYFPSEGKGKEFIEPRKTTWQICEISAESALFFNEMFNFVSHSCPLHCKTFKCICAVYIPDPKWMHFLSLLLWWIFNYQLRCLGYFPCSYLANNAEKSFFLLGVTKWLLAS